MQTRGLPKQSFSSFHIDLVIKMSVGHYSSDGNGTGQITNEIHQQYMAGQGIGLRGYLNDIRVFRV